MSPPRFTPYGERALLVEVDSLDDVARWSTALQTAAIAGVIDVVPAARSVLLQLSDAVTPESIRRLVEAVTPAEPAGPAGSIEAARSVVEIPVTYDGPDLADVAAATGLTVEAVVRAHQDSAWRVGFAGFAPGFAYLVGGDPRLHVARRPTPRTQVPAGSVALAGGYSAVYPRSSPGGWQLIGRTDQALWDTDRDPPALLLPGRTVRFVQAGQ